LRDQVAHAVVHAGVEAASVVAASLGLSCEPEAGQRHAAEAEAESLQRRAARDRSGHAFGEFT